MADSTLTPSRLWKRMTLDQRLQAALAFWTEDQATEDQVQAVMIIVQAKKVQIGRAHV